MKTKVFVFLAGVFLAAQACWAQDVLDGIVAVVGDEIILRSEWLQEAQGVAVMQRVNPMTQTGEFNKIKTAVLENLISSRVLLAKAEEDTITVDDQTVLVELENKIKNMVDQLGSEAKVEEYFGKPISRIKKDFFDEQKKLMIVSKVQQEKLQPVQVSRRGVEQFYNTLKDSLPQRPPMVKMRHILMEVDAGEAARAEALRKIEDIKKRLDSGEDFAEIAKQFSQDPGSASNGGELGFVDRGTFVPEFEEAAFQLKNGETSGIVETQFGFHILKMVENRGDRVNVRHILIQLPRTEDDDQRVLSEITDIRNQIKNGASFAEMAKEYSDDAESQDKGGDLGWLPVNTLQIREFRMVADTLGVGKVSQPFKTQFGYHLVLIEDKEAAGPLRLDEDWDRIQSMALNQKQQQILTDWVDDLKQNMNIEIREDLF